MNGKSRIALLAAFAWVPLTLAGCGYSTFPQEQKLDDGTTKQPLQLGGYTAGFIQPSNVKTVYVQVFSSLEFRREIEYRLTEALVKRILMETPYTIAKKDEADTILYGELKSVPFSLMGSDFASQLPKEVQTVLVVDWTWKNRRTNQILAQRRGQEQAAEFIPLGGETSYDGIGIAINRISERIVEAMAADW